MINHFDTEKCVLTNFQQCSVQVIRESAPCHLYFDMECPATLNPDVHMDRVVDALLAHADKHLR
jgi:hypothetical protein